MEEDVGYLALGKIGGTTRSIPQHRLFGCDGLTAEIRAITSHFRLGWSAGVW